MIGIQAQQILKEKGYNPSMVYIQDGHIIIIFNSRYGKIDFGTYSIEEHLRSKGINVNLHMVVVSQVGDSRDTIVNITYKIEGGQ